jgi:SAM-dependent methyltransferase
MDEFLAKGWDDIAEAYQKRYQVKVSPIVYCPFGPTEEELNLIGEKRDKRIIDIGAGACQKAIYLAKGGSKVTAFDISKKQLEIGKRLANEQGVDLEFVHGDFQEIERYFNSETFDSAYSVFAMQYARNISMLEKSFRGINSILKNKGVFVFSMDHPCRKGHWNEDNQFIFDNYFDRTENNWDYSFPECGINGKFRGSCWTLSDMVNAFIRSGFRLETMLEPEPIKRDDSFDNFGIETRYGKYNKKDIFLFDHLRKVPGSVIIRGVKE